MNPDIRNALAFMLIGAGGGNPASAHQLLLKLKEDERLRKAQEQFGGELQTLMTPQAFHSPTGPDNPAPMTGYTQPDPMRVSALLARAPKGYDTSGVRDSLMLQQRASESMRQNALDTGRFEEQRRQFEAEEKGRGTRFDLELQSRERQAELDRQSAERRTKIGAAGVGQDQSMPGWGLYSDPVNNTQFRMNSRTGEARTLDNQPYTPKAAVPLSQDPSGVFGASAARASGTGSGQVAATLPQAEVSYNNAVKVISEFDLPQVKAQAPYGLGAGGLLPTVPGVNSDFNTRAEQLRGIGFLQAYQSLKGGGPISEVEGTKATGAQMRLNQAQTVSEFYTALKDAKALLDDAFRAQSEIARRGSTAPQMQRPAQPRPSGRIPFRDAAGTGGWKVERM